MSATTFGSLSVQWMPTTSPKWATARSQNRPNRSAVSGASQPPPAAAQRGVVKWWYVTTGTMPCAWHMSIMRRQWSRALRENSPFSGSMRDHSIENRYAPNPRSASSAMSSGKRQKWSHASPDGSAHPEPGVCSHSHQSLFQLSPSTWCAAVAVPQRKPSGNEIAMGRDARRPYTRQRMGVLDEILAAKRAELALLQESEARNTLRRAALDAAPPRDFAGALCRPDGRLAVVAEIKRRSPSKGDLAPDLDPAVVAKAYESGGAAALSVLTDRPFFGGSVDDLQTAHAKVEIPVVRKDFVIDETQVYEARAIGADAVLLIVAALPDDAELAGLRVLADEIGLAALVEVHDGAELDRALGAGAAVIGVNARDPDPVARRRPPYGRRRIRIRPRRRGARPQRRPGRARERDEPARCPSEGV